MHHFAEKIHLNNHLSLSRDDFKNLVNRFKDLFDEIELSAIDVESAKIGDGLCPIKGNYAAWAKIGNATLDYKGNWVVNFVVDDNLGYWYIENVHIEGVDL